MEGTENLEAMFQEMKCLMELEGEYLSHQTALFLLGQSQALPTELTAVSQRRRRNRQVGKRLLVFVYHPEEKPRNIISTSFSKITLPVSTLEKTLLDLLTDLHHAPPLRELAGFFVRLPYNPHLLLSLARQVSDTVLKRASFLTAWAGRARWKEIPFPSFKRTPVKLDPRNNPDRLAWEKRFFLKISPELLGVPLAEPPQSLDSDISEWIELRRYPPFLDWMVGNGHLAIQGAPEGAEGPPLDSFFSALFLGIQHKELEPLLLAHFGRIVEAAHPHRFPVRFNRWLEEHHQILLQRRKEVEDIILRNISAASIDRVEVALHFGSLLGMDDLVIEHFAKQSYKLFSAGRFDFVNRITRKYLAKDRPLPHYFYVVAARTMARQDRFDEAIAVVDRGKAIFEERENSEVESGELAYAAGNIFRLMNKANEAMSELLLAREFFNVANDRRRLATADCSLGNLYFTRGAPREARRYYMAALSAMKSLGERDAQASLLGNLGGVEYDCGRFRKAALFLTQAIRLQRLLKNSWNQAIAQLSLGKVFLKMGHFSKAMRVLMECHKLKIQQNHESGVLESAALLAWISELIGNPAAAKAWWDMIPDLTTRTLEPRAIFVITGVRAMTALLSGDYGRAKKLYETMLAKSKNCDGTDIESGDCLHGIAVCETLRGDPLASTTLAEAEKRFSKNPQRNQLMQIRIFGALFFPEKFSHVDLDEQITLFLDAQSFEPFWGLFATKMQARATPGSERFLEYHLHKTPPSMLSMLFSRNRDFKRMIQRIEARRSRTAEFLTCIEDGNTRPMHVDDYHAWRKNYPTQHLVFDGPLGILAWKDHVAFIKPGSIPHGILAQLFVAFPHPVDVEALYQTVWQTPFDPETDVGAFKSSLQRIQKILRSVTPSAKIRRRKTRSTFCGIALELSCHWETIL